MYRTMAQIEHGMAVLADRSRLQADQVKNTIKIQRHDHDHGINITKQSQDLSSTDQRAAAIEKMVDNDPEMLMVRGWGVYRGTLLKYIGALGVLKIKTLASMVANLGHVKNKAAYFCVCVKPLLPKTQ